MKFIKVFHDEGVVDIQLINDFENDIGYKLPNSYKNLLSQHNFLHPENCDFDFYDVSLGRIASRDITFLGFGPNISGPSNIANAQWHDVYGRDHVLVFGKTAGGDLVCFDYRSDPTTDNPSIVVMLHDYFNEKDNKMFVCSVADSFEQFINSLYSVENED